MLFGEYEHQVDAKYRIRIPAKLKQDFQSGYVFLRGAAKCISVYPADKIDDLIGRFTTVDPFSPEAQEDLGVVLSNFFSREEDVQGRIILPDSLREYANINKDVVSIGMINHIDIYSKDEYDRIKSAKNYSDSIKNLKGRMA